MYFIRSAESLHVVKIVGGWVRVTLFGIFVIRFDWLGVLSEMVETAKWCLSG